MANSNCIQLRRLLTFSVILCCGSIFLYYPSHLQRVIDFASDVVDVSINDSSGLHATARTKTNAYAFLIAGCDPSKPGAYRGYIYNILAATYILSKSGSQLDVVVMVRMSAKSTLDALPVQEERWLRSAGAVIKYLPRVNDVRSDSFYTATLDKFQVLELIEYERVLFLDSDVIPLCNLDYLFDMMPSDSGNTTLMRDNLVIAWKTEPSNAGFFILRTGPGQLDELNEIIRMQAERDKNTWPPFDEIEGWGHNLSSSHAWKDIFGRGGNKWSFYCAFSDQGLLYYWTKYAKKDVSIVINSVVEHWSDEDGDGEVEMIGKSPTSDLIDRHSCSKGDLLQRAALRRSGIGYKHAPYRDFHHFTGMSKPWLPKYKYSIPPDKMQPRENITDAMELWYHALRRQVELHSLGDEIDVDHLCFNSSNAPLGMYPTHYSVNEHAKAIANMTLTSGGKVDNTTSA
eukprot:CAMPEP_0194202448 /NCGR_PEP_ID=MMETSP0156-20130528/2461_1 /TAXON_ID=33649 /ORGANISM="Thalassionema nitzschioides, Strain L26-B" /LENGTH=456 /DNA_ID=CAMNT_0038927937 /DNA_START=52 /DNA_END=1422 /DNA_ORIENTATION=+